MTKANESPSPTQTSPEPGWEAGVRRTTKDGRLLALSPEPVTTGERAVDVGAWIRRKTEGWLDVQGGDWLFVTISAVLLSFQCEQQVRGSVGREGGDEEDDQGRDICDMLAEARCVHGVPTA